MTLRDDLLTARDAIDRALASLEPENQEPPQVAIMPGQNFGQAYLDALPGTVFMVDPGVVIDQLIEFKKPARVFGIWSEPRGAQTRATQAETMPRFAQGIAVMAPGCEFNTVQIDVPGPRATGVIDAAEGTVLDRVRILGVGKRGKRGILAHGQNTKIARCLVAGINSDVDSQAIVGWDGSRDIQIIDNYLEASGNTIMFGGADAKSADRMPCRIFISDNVITKDASQRSVPELSFKNLLELKAASDVIVEDNELVGSWKDAQDGYAILLTVRNQNGNAPWSTIRNVAIRRNRVTQAGSGIQVLGSDDRAGYVSQRLEAVTFADNLFELDNGTMGGMGRGILLNRGSKGLRFERNTIRGVGLAKLNSFLYFASAALDPQPHEGLQFVGNTVTEGAYGLAGDGTTPGKATWEFYAPGSLWSGNAVKRSGVRTITYPEGTTLL